MPAITGTLPFTASTVVATTDARSRSSMHGNSPVVPVTQMPWTPLSRTYSISRRSEGEVDLLLIGERGEDRGEDPPETAEVEHAFLLAFMRDSAAVGQG